VAAGTDDPRWPLRELKEKTIYLIPDYESDEEGWAILEEVYDEVFQSELWGWHTDQSGWPRDRTFKMFQEWFEVEFHSMVEDLCGYEIWDEDD
jgi:hypothetical protein